MMSMNHELSENPGVLLDRNFDSKLVRLEGIGLGDDYNKIGLIDVVEVYVHGYHQPYVNFTDRIKQFKNHDGFIHMAGKFSFGIKNRKIDEIRLSGKYVDPLKKYRKETVINAHGEPSQTLTDSITWGFDYTEYGNVLVYADKKLYFNIGTDTNRITEILIGNVSPNRFE